MRPEYSPLCDTDKELYSEYLRACVDHGKCIGISEGEHRCADGKQFDGGCDNVKLYVGGADGSCDYKEKSGCSCGVLVHEFPFDKFDFIDSCSGSKFACCGPVRRLASSCVGSYSCRTYRHVCNGPVPCARQFFANSADGNGTDGRRQLVDVDLSGEGVNCEDSSSEILPSGEKLEKENVVESKLERNRRWRKERKEKKKKRQSMDKDWRLRSNTFRSKFDFNPEASDESGVSLRKSLEGKWRVQNELAAEKARRELEVLKASDLDQEVKQYSLKAKWRIQNELAVEKARRELEVLKVSDIEQEVKQYRTKVSAATERNMVSIEKTHARLRQTGNLPEERGGGFAETVVSGVPGLESGSGTISPDSSASMAEFRACQKALLDAERENAEYKRKIKIASEKYGFPLEQVDFLDKEVWTDTQTNQDILDEIYPNGYGKDTSLFEDGKFRAIGV